jgi:hypothetical protein
MSESLEELIFKNNLTSCDHAKGTDKYSFHRYIQDFYEKVFFEIQNKNIYLLEVGTGTGASLLIWQQYFANGKILGIDKTNQILPSFYDRHISYLICNAYNKDDVDHLDNLDVAIDDGSHVLEDQLQFIEIYFNKLNKNGLLIIEDIDINNFQALSGAIKGKTLNSVGLLDNREKTGLNNSCLIWVKK